MIRHECYKVISAKAIIFLAMAVLVINVVLLWHMEKDKTSYTADEYNSEWKNMTAEAKNVGWESVFLSLTDKLAAFDESNLTIKERIALKESEDYYKKELYNDLKDELSFQMDYNGYLTGIDEAAERYKAISLFGNVDSYAYRDIMKMKKAYADIERIELTPAASAGIEMAATSGITDILALVVLLCVAVTVWLKEREQKIMLLLRTSYKGRGSLAASKIAVMILSCIFLGIGLYGGNAVAASFMYGLGDLGRPLATVYDYGRTLWEISVGEFLILNAVFKIIAYIWVSLLISAVCCRLTSSVAAFGGIIFFGAVGCLMYYKISYQSPMVAFKFLNPFAVLKTELLFDSYNGLNFFQYPVDYRVCMAVLLPAGLLLFTVLTVRAFADYIIKSQGKLKAILVWVIAHFRWSVIRVRRMFERHTSVLGHELYRIFICHGAILVIVVLVVLVSNDSKPYNVIYEDMETYCERIYLEKIKGPVTQETIEYLETEETRVRKLTDDYSRAQRKAISRIYLRIAYVEEHEGACLLYDEPHNMLTAYYSNFSDFMHAVICMIPIVLIMSCFFAPDLQNNMQKVTDVTMYGKKRLKRLRYVLGTVLSVLIAAGIHLAYFLQEIVSHEVEPEVFTYPAISLTNLSELDAGISIAEYYIITYLLRIIFTVFGAFLVYFFSELFRSQAYTTLVGFIVLVVPTLAVLYDYRLKPAAYPYAAMFGNMFIQEKTARIVCMITVVLLLILMRLLISLRNKTGFFGKKLRRQSRR